MKRKFAVFDIDGTLIRWQLYHAVVDKLAGAGLLGKEAEEKLHRARMVWKNREHPEAFAGYENNLITIFESALHQIKTAEFDEMIDKVIDQYKNQIYTYTRGLVKDLKAKGYFLIAISGSHHELVERLAKYYEFDDWVGTHYEREAGGFSGKKFIASKDKSAVLEQIIEKYGLSSEGSYGVGDSKTDVSMLQIVDNPIAFNPNQALYEIAKSHGWPIVIERKNVVYRINESNDRYILQ
ncbi:hypothetical protein A3F37_02745 [Candidatus Saccharibacteria bacterium RIFCSPHIGHO2_12_FULL_41_12]|nr:MAG: hypothetical protein A3F37_02745 [Candidatus Saccharibacteria bacterium RIFCSPHIGHO2_12_FULL_41_12]